MSNDNIVNNSHFTFQLILIDTGFNGLEQLNSSIFKFEMLNGARNQN